MKKVFYISAVILGLGFVSCQKQELAPAQELEAPEWEEFDSGTSARGAADDNGSPTDNGGTVIDDGITDPNGDPDDKDNDKPQEN